MFSSIPEKQVPMLIIYLKLDILRAKTPSNRKIPSYYTLPSSLGPFVIKPRADDWCFYACATDADKLANSQRDRRRESLANFSDA